ncbi:hypothetical protein ONR57_10315 [Hoyosella sp. YIM 151337]|uniref:hypothetical protein n=1 Tax=Hoyosella sp. YIM 151337 TaxID=2992742 RepID=UPI002235FA72|nr:hypothetical protein [Hoyosella sp. YIM 151337]MCW4353689.1 hypothetical protein [Hoyosella sp. YIM 151337]
MKTQTRSTAPLSMRATLQLDAVVTGLNGLAYVAGATVLDELIGPAAPTLVAIGLFLTGYAILVGWAGTRSPVNRRMAIVIAEVNAAWVAASLVVAATGALSLTTVGRVWVVVQALVVTGFVILQVKAARG